MPTSPRWNQVLRGLREARGISQAGWAARWGYSRRTIQHWEHGDTVPDGEAEAALITLCDQLGLFAHAGPERLTANTLRSLLAEARLIGAGPSTERPLNSPVPDGAEGRARQYASRSTNLPVPLSSFFGREREVDDVLDLLSHARLVTLTGPGGTGKTRLAITVGQRLLAAYPDGVWFVDLAPIADPAAVPRAVAQTLGVQEQSGVPLRDTLGIVLRDRQLLLLLDNFEHLLTAAPFTSVLLQLGPEVAVLATSRAPLRVAGEREYGVPPLPRPSEHAVTPADLATNPAIALFVARAQAVRADFVLSDGNAATVAAICSRLDGLPLAIELAAARSRAIPPTTLLSRLLKRLPVLTGGHRDAPARQQTLRDTIAWSYALLSPAEQTLFHRLAVFVGGCTLELATAVCDVEGDLGLDVLDGMSSLVEKSLLNVLDGPDGAPRYQMLETIREFAQERMVAVGDAEVLERRHAIALVALAEAAGEAFLSPEWVEGRRLEAERHNLRAAFAWAVAHQDAEVASRLTAALWGWHYWQEDVAIGKAWAEQALAMPGADAPTVARAGVLATLGLMHAAADDYRSAVAELREAVALFRTLGRRRDLSLALANLASIYPGTSRTGVGLLGESRALAEETGGLFERATVLYWHGYHAWQRGEHERVRAAAEACLAAAQRLMQPSLLECASRLRAMVAVEQADPEAGRYVAHMLTAAQAWGVPRLNLLAALSIASVYSLQAGQPREALATAVEGLRVAEVSGARRGFDIILLEVLACVWTSQGHELERATRLLGTAASVRNREFSDRYERLVSLVEQTTVSLQQALGEVTFAAAFASGRSLTRDDAIGEALAVPATRAASPAPPLS
jgi:predicted ATPase/DNA-binding XRE family transcriptional regulator